MMCARSLWKSVKEASEAAIPQDQGHPRRHQAAWRSPYRLLASALYRQYFLILCGCEADLSTRQLQEAISCEHGFNHQRVMHTSG
jgi:hypothetical protein